MFAGWSPSARTHAARGCASTNRYRRSNCRPSRTLTMASLPRRAHLSSISSRDPGLLLVLRDRLEQFARRELALTFLQAGGDRLVGVVLDHRLGGLERAADEVGHQIVAELPNLLALHAAADLRQVEVLQVERHLDNLRIDVDLRRELLEIDLHVHVARHARADGRVGFASDL